MCIEGQQQDLVLNDENTIEHCYGYKYLGTNVSHAGALDKAIKDRTTAGRRAITLLNSILWNQTINEENIRDHSEKYYIIYQ